MSAPLHNAVASECVDEVSLRIPTVKLLSLFLSGSLHVEDFRCLDPCSKNLVQRLLLSACGCPLAGEKPPTERPNSPILRRNRHGCRIPAKKTDAFLPR